MLEYCIPFRADDALDSLDDHLKIKARYNVFYCMYSRNVKENLLAVAKMAANGGSGGHRYS